MNRMLLAGLIALAPLGAETTVIKNATIMTESGKGTFKGSIVMRDGKITEVGENVMIPEGATVIDATGEWVTPGIIDCHTHIGVDGNVNEMSLSVTSMVNIKDVINPEDIAIYRALAGGVTVGNVLHGSANSIGGQTIVIKMRWGKDADGMIFKEAKPGIKFALGENPKRAGNPQAGSPSGQPLRYPATRMGVEDTIREAFNQAVAYKAEWDKYDAAVKAGENPIPPRKDLKLESLKEVLEGKRYVHAHCYRGDEILMLIRIADDYGFKIRTFQHVMEGYKVAKEIAAHGAGASTFSDWFAYKMEVFDAIPYNAVIMEKKGVVVSLNSDSENGELMGRLNTEAAKAVKYGGVSREDALAMVTLNPARQLGVDQYVGSIEAGKDADLVIFDKDPLSTMSKAQKVWIDGNKYFDRDSDISARPAKEAERKKLMEAEKQPAAPERRPQ